MAPHQPAPRQISLIQSAIILLIRIYQYLFSAFLGFRCRFQPSCSTYAQEAVKMHGSLKGCYLGVRRILRCHPWHSGGLDPVPTRDKNNHNL